MTFPTGLQALSKRLRHRGPDWSGTKMTEDSILVHERLAIVGVGAYNSFILLSSYPARLHLPRPVTDLVALRLPLTRSRPVTVPPNLPHLYLRALCRDDQTLELSP